MDNESVHKSGQKKCTHKMDKKSVHTKMGTSDQIVIINRIWSWGGHAVVTLWSCRDEESRDNQNWWHIPQLKVAEDIQCETLEKYCVKVDRPDLT